MKLARFEVVRVSVQSLQILLNYRARKGQRIERWLL